MLSTGGECGYLGGVRQWESAGVWPLTVLLIKCVIIDMFHVENGESWAFLIFGAACTYIFNIFNREFIDPRLI